MASNGSRRSCPPSARRLPTPFRGPLQWAVLKTLMGGEALTARQVEGLVNADRSHRDDAALPRLAYTTVRTALERLVERGIVRRERRGPVFVYRSSALETELVDQLVTALVEGLSGFGPGTLRAVRDRIDCKLEDSTVAS